MSEEAKQLRHNAVIIDGYARGLLDQARAMQQKAAELEEEANPLQMYRCRSFINGTIEFDVHAPDEETARRIARRWAQVFECTFEMSNDMGEMLDDDDLPARWDITNERVIGTDACTTKWVRVDG